MTKDALELLHSTKDVTDAVLLEEVNLQASQLDNQITQTAARQTDYKSLILYALIVLVLLGSLVIFLK